MNDIRMAINYWKQFKKEIKKLREIKPGTEWDEQEKATGLAISALEKQISIKEVINQLRENKINCKNSSTIYDTKDYVLLDKAIEIVKSDWRVGE